MPEPRELSLSRNLKRVLEIAVLTGALVTIPLTVALEEHPGLSWIQIADSGQSRVRVIR
jgi:hypothetical protein